MQAYGNIILVGPDGSFGLAGLETQRYWIRIRDGSHVCHRSCAYAVLQTVQMPGVRSVVYGTVHYKEPLKALHKSRVYFRLRASFCREIAMIVQKAT